MEVRGFYTIKDQFFEDFSDDQNHDNKHGSRPYYYAFTDKNTGLHWMIPMTTKTSKHVPILNAQKAYRKPSDGVVIARLDNGRENAFVIEDMIPVSDEYIGQPYDLGGNQMKLSSDIVAKQVDTKARRVHNMIHRRVRINQYQPNALAMEEAQWKQKARVV